MYVQDVHLVIYWNQGLSSKDLANSNDNVLKHEISFSDNITSIFYKHIIISQETGIRKTNQNTDVYT